MFVPASRVTAGDRKAFSPFCALFVFADDEACSFLSLSDGGICPSSASVDSMRLNLAGGWQGCESSTSRVFDDIPLFVVSQLSYPA